MAIQFADLVGETASNKPTAGGTFNLSGTAITGLNKFVDQITSGNQVICKAESSAGWMTFLGTFTDGTPDTLSVDSVRDSSTGSAIDFSGGDTVNIRLVADASYFNTLNVSALLTNKSETVTTANITGEVGKLHVCSIAGLTANRDFVLPATAAVGDRVGVAITDGDDTYALLLKPDAADTINGGSAGVEYTRLLVAGEIVIFRCVTANSAWIVEYANLDNLETIITGPDGAGGGQTVAGSTWVKITNCNTVVRDPVLQWDTTNKKFIPKRKGRWKIGACQVLGSGAPLADGKKVIVTLYKNGTRHKLLSRGYTGGAAASAGFGSMVDIVLTSLTDYIEIYIFHDDTTSDNYLDATYNYFTATWEGF